MNNYYGLLLAICVCGQAYATKTYYPRTYSVDKSVRVSPVSKQVSKSTEALVTQLVKLTFSADRDILSIKRRIEFHYDQVRRALTQLYSHKQPEITVIVEYYLEKICARELTVQNIQARLKNKYIRAYTQEQLKELIKFFKSKIPNNTVQAIVEPNTLINTIAYDMLKEYPDLKAQVLKVLKQIQ